MLDKCPAFFKRLPLHKLERNIMLSFSPASKKKGEVELTDEALAAANGGWHHGEWRHEHGCGPRYGYGGPQYCYDPYEYCEPHGCYRPYGYC